MSKQALFISLIVGVIIGFTFVYWPRAHGTYNGPMGIEGSLCTGIQQYQPGISESGFPFITRTVYFGACANTDNSLSEPQAVEDFIIGAIVGGLVGAGFYQSFRKYIKKPKYKS